MKTSAFVAGFFLVSLFLSQTAVNAFLLNFGCAQRTGCHKGQCWMTCSHKVFNPKGTEWCFTKNIKKKTYDTCLTDYDCFGYACSQCMNTCSSAIKN